jgi:hypothetical protein
MQILLADTSVTTVARSLRIAHRSVLAISVAELVLVSVGSQDPAKA